MREPSGAFHMRELLFSVLASLSVCRTATNSRPLRDAAEHITDGTQLSYAAGLEIGKYHGLNIVSHSGGDAGYRADLIRFPDQHFSVALLCNLASINPSALSRKIADIYLASSFSAASPSATVPALSPQPTSEQLRKWAGLYLDPEESDRVMRVRLGGTNLQSGLNADGRLSDLEATSDVRFR